MSHPSVRHIRAVVRESVPQTAAHQLEWIRAASLARWFAVIVGILGWSASAARAATNQFRGVNWADSRDNFQSGVLYVSGLSSSDTYASAATVGDRVMSDFVAKLGANTVRMPINEPTVSQYWSVYTGAIDSVLAKGNVILCYWAHFSGSKPDTTAFMSMWRTVVDKYGSNSNAYFEVFNEPAGAYNATSLRDLYNSWLTQFPSVPKGRVILDGTGYADNVKNVAADSRLDGCLFAVHIYTMFSGSPTTPESAWMTYFNTLVGGYQDRTVCTEWGAPMSPGSKNGVSYGTMDYNQPATNYFEAYVRGITSQMRSWGMGSVYWPGFRDGDWYSMMKKSGSGSTLALSVVNQSGLDRLQYAWGGVPAGGSDGGMGGSTGSGGSGEPAAGGRSGADGAMGGSNVSSAAGGESGKADASVGGATGRGGSGGTNDNAGGGSSIAGGSSAPSTSGGTTAADTVGSGGGGTAGSGSTGSKIGGTAGAGESRPGGSGGTAGASMPPGGKEAGCSCVLGVSRRNSTNAFAALLGISLLGFGWWTARPRRRR